LLTGLTIRNQDTSEMASLLLYKHLFPKHPYGQPIDGYIDTIQSITKTDIVQFHVRNYAPNELITVVVGPIDESEICNLAEAYFASWEKDKITKTAKKPLPNPPSNIVRKHKYIEGKSQVDLLMGCFGPARTSPDYTPVYVGNNILGQFGLMGRIGKSVRSKSGLAYYASSSVSSWSDVGTWEFSAGVNPENLEKTVNLIRKEIGDFINRPVLDDELDNSKSHLIGRMPMSLESNAGLANAILTMQRFNLGLDYYQNYKSRIQSITSSQILESSKRYLHPDRLVITSAGTGKDIL
jgi:zinc protease